MGRRVQLTGSPYHRRIPAGAVDVSRPTRWQNPFRVELYGRERALELYRGWLYGDEEAVAEARRIGCKLKLHGPALVDAIRAELADVDLACWCGPSEECHADEILAVLAALAEPYAEGPDVG